MITFHSRMVLLELTDWTIQDLVDDVKIGMRSMAILFADYTIPVCTVTAIVFLCLLCYSGMQNGQGFAFYSGVAVAGLLLLTRVVSTDIHKPEQCRRLFLGTALVGQIILAGLVLDAVTHRIVSGIPL